MSSVAIAVLTLFFFNQVYLHAHLATEEHYSGPPISGDVQQAPGHRCGHCPIVAISSDGPDSEEHHPHSEDEHLVDLVTVDPALTISPSPDQPFLVAEFPQRPITVVIPEAVYTANRTRGPPC